MDRTVVTITPGQQGREIAMQTAGFCDDKLVDGRAGRDCSVGGRTDAAGCSDGGGVRVVGCEGGEVRGGRLELGSGVGCTAVKPAAVGYEVAKEDDEEEEGESSVDGPEGGVGLWWAPFVVTVEKVGVGKIWMR